MKFTESISYIKNSLHKIDGWILSKEAKKQLKTMENAVVFGYNIAIEEMKRKLKKLK